MERFESGYWGVLHSWSLQLHHKAIETACRKRPLAAMWVSDRTPAALLVLSEAPV